MTCDSLPNVLLSPLHPRSTESSRNACKNGSPVVSCGQKRAPTGIEVPTYTRIQILSNHHETPPFIFSPIPFMLTRPIPTSLPITTSRISTSSTRILGRGPQPAASFSYSRHFHRTTQTWTRAHSSTATDRREPPIHWFRDGFTWPHSISTTKFCQTQRSIFDCSHLDI